jgi:bifunctional UDP-N-acetylglucosamine pyrophosphorylase/glucosamine-1-phosphate N-acetyltransferase
MELAAVIMAAGMGTRMKSNLPKVLHPLMGKPLLSYVLSSVASLNPVKIAVVTGHEAQQVQCTIGSLPTLSQLPLSFVVQEPQLGTGHAVQQAETELYGLADGVLVLPGDLPLLSVETVHNLAELFQQGDSTVVMLTVRSENPRGFGRIVRDADGFVSTVVEEADCTADQLAINELNVGGYIFDADWLWENLSKIPISAKGEYYVTDLIGIAVKQGNRVRAYVVDDKSETVGINNRVHLAEAEQSLRKKINRNWMEAGVTLVDPATTYIQPGVELGQDTVVYPNTHLLGATTIGRSCVIGPNSYLEDAMVGDGCVIRFSVIEQAVLENSVDVGPFAHLRKGAHLATGVHMGNFGEVKNSYLGPGTKMGHFSYMGDATTGKNVNIGAGTITCNYDGKHKNKTVIGNNTFIGSDTMLVAPLNIGENAKTGAGSVVTKDVPDNSLAYGVPAKIKNTD